MSVLIVGEFISDVDFRNNTSFSDGFWRFFKSQLAQAGIPPYDCNWTNVINLPPPSYGGMFSFCARNKGEGIRGMSYLTRGNYVREEYRRHITELYALINRLSPNIIIAVGDMAMWALTQEPTLEYARGRVTMGVYDIRDRKVIPVYHPRSVIQDNSLRPILAADLRKAQRESTFSEVRRPKRLLHLRPSIDDLESFYNEFIKPSSELSVDIETKGSVTTCVGIAPSPDRCLVIPFFDEEHSTGNYWRTAREEIIAWRFVRRMMALPNTEIFGQNFSYDVQYLWRENGIPVPAWTGDTMLMHHALQPEMKKGLGFLASIYTDELAWKFMAKRRAADRSGKKED